MQRLLVGLALAWGVLLVVLSATLPIYTLPNSQGSFQPRETALVAYGAAGLLPAFGLLVTGVLITSLLLRRRSGSTTSARVLAIAVLVASYGSLLILHIWSLLVVPYGALLVAAAFAPQVRAQRRGRPRIVDGD